MNIKTIKGVKAQRKWSLYFILILFFLHYVPCAQTFTNNTGGVIPDGASSPTFFPVNVSGVGNINNNFGVANVCIDITHSWVGDLEIYIKAPDGTKIPLSIQNGASGDNFSGTCFNGTSSIPISNGKAPFSGEFTPDGALSTLNNGQNADGEWLLCVQDLFESGSGNVNSWSITFNNTPAPPPPPIPLCLGNPPAGNTCTNASPVCNFNGYCGNTSGNYTADFWPELKAAFCGDIIDNNSFVSFVASENNAVFNIWVSNSQNGEGIQMMFFSGGCGSGAVVNHGCYSQIKPSVYPSIVSAKNLIPGKTYYLMFDGFSGDICNYTIEPVSGVNILKIKASSNEICKGSPVTLNASGANGIYSWSGPALVNTSGATVTAFPTDNAIYTVTLDAPIGNCSISQDIKIGINPKPDLGPDQKDTICTGKPVDITKKFFTGLLNVVWTKNNQPVINPENISDSGLYRIKATNLAGCSDTAFVRIALQKNFSVNAGNDTTAVRNQPHQLKATGAESYIWSPENMLNNPTSQTPQAILTQDQKYIVTGFNAKGCSASDTIFIKVYDGPTYYIPKAFSPNGDGINDVFRPIPVGIVNTELLNIYNRNGNLIFSGRQSMKGWDGTYLGKPQPTGSYVWYIKGKDKDGKQILMKGSILLIR
ncbi:MAG: T9SS type B sorting domain-containing protein [Ferruginibacter sp.]|nr:T9SS type B sorting domain-containing protein [Ferruginibacter sp.]